MEIIDAHVHSLPRGTMDGGETDARLETVLSGLRAHNISRAIFVPINDAWWQPVDDMNDYMVEVVRKHPSIVGFIDIDISKAHLYGGIERLEKDIEMRYSSGLRGTSGRRDFHTYLRILAMSGSFSALISRRATWILR